MSQTSEIKCPACGQWNQGNNRMDETCTQCNSYLDPTRVEHAREQVLYEANRKKSDFLVVKEGDETIVEIFKIFMTPIRTATYYGVGLIFIVVAIALVVFGMVV
jgi:hypothetical protein